jgi:hypothetical protein
MSWALWAILCKTRLQGIGERIFFDFLTRSAGGMDYIVAIARPELRACSGRQKAARGSGHHAPRKYFTCARTLSSSEFNGSGNQAPK